MLLLDYTARYIRSRDIAPNSSAQLRYAAQSLHRYLSGDAAIERLDSIAINGWIGSLLETRARETARSQRRMIVTILRAAAGEGIIPAVPTIRPIKQRDRLIDGYSVADMRALIAAAAQLRGKFRSLPVARSVWWTTFLRVAWSTGLRLGDVLSIDRAAIIPSGRLHIVQHKTGRAIIRTISPEGLAGIAAIADACPGRAFAIPPYCRRNAFYGHFRRLATAAGLAGTARWIRRGSASEVEKEHPGCGWKHLGHAAPGLAERSYLVPRIVGERIIGPPEV